MERVGTTRGRIKAISVSKERGTQKSNVHEAELREGFGIVGDAHAGDWHRQVSLLGVESVRKAAAGDSSISPGDFAENITTEGIDLSFLKVGSRLRIGGGAELEVTQLGKRCEGRCQIYERLGDCIMPRDGIFARVTRGGRIRVGDAVEVVDD
ncbi:MAG: MOSC domain-containing protein [Phycisphaerales bacterium]|nr:MAG: MOSC domain-containing protein [Phycisphaerales bacterium]